MKCNEILTENKVDDAYDALSAQAEDGSNPNAVRAMGLLNRMERGNISNSDAKKLNDLRGKVPEVDIILSGMKKKQNSTEIGGGSSSSTDDMSPRQLKKAIANIDKDAMRLTRKAAKDMKDAVEKSSIKGGTDADHKKTIADFMEGELGEYNTFNDNPKLSVQDTFKLATDTMISAYKKFLKDEYMGKKEKQGGSAPTDTPSPSSKKKQEYLDVAPDKTPENVAMLNPNSRDSVIDFKGHKLRWMGQQWAQLNPETRKWQSGKIKNSTGFIVYREVTGEDFVQPVTKDGKPLKVIDLSKL